MLYTFAEAISAVSAEQPLHPGDVFGGGTIGRGCGYELDRWIQPGDVVELDVTGIGVLRNLVGARNAPPTSGPDLSAPAQPSGVTVPTAPGPRASILSTRTENR